MKTQLRDLPALLCVLALLAAAADSCSLAQSAVTIVDDTPVGTVIVPVLVTGSDSLDSATTNTDPNNAGQPFQALSNNSLLLTAIITAPKVLRVTCMDGSKELLIVNMIDTDNNAPTWTQAIYTDSVRETQSVPFEIPVKPKATDEPDKNSGQVLYYRILPSEYSSYFNLNSPNQTVVNITLVKQLDYEKVQQVNLTLQVLDYNSTGQLMFTVNATLIITVINENDENPMWLSCTAGAPSGICYVRQLLANSTAGTAVQPPVKAVDGNLNMNNTLYYTILSQSPANILAVDNSTGALTLVTNLPVPQQYTIVLTATQVIKEDRVSNAQLLLNIVSASYAPPVFDKSVYNVTVFENNPPLQVVVVVKATDQLRKGVTYGLQNFLTVFQMDSVSGELKVTGSLDYESVSFYSVNVSATDGTGFGFATVTVTVGNVNEFNPTFVQAQYTFAAASRDNGLVVGTVNATDGDLTNVTYYITDPDFRKLFSVDAYLGQVKIGTVSANLPEQSYRFGVTATDGSRTGDTTVIVSFDSALTSVANASVTTIPLIVLGCVFAVIIVAVIVAYVLYRRNAAAKSAGGQGPDEEGSEVPGSYAYGDLYELGSTTQQENPVEGYNNFMFGDEGEPDPGTFNRERDQGELFVSNGYYAPASANDFSTLTNGSVHTVSGGSSLVGSQRTLVHGSRPRQLHAGSNLQVVQVENAVDASSDLPAGDRQGRNGPGLTVYF